MDLTNYSRLGIYNDSSPNFRRTPSGNFPVALFMRSFFPRKNRQNRTAAQMCKPQETCDQMEGRPGICKYQARLRFAVWRSHEDLLLGGWADGMGEIAKLKSTKHILIR